MNVAEEYFWAITQEARASCCGRSGSGVLVFRFKEECLVHIYVSIHTYTHTHTHTHIYICTVELHLSGLVRAEIHPDMQKIRIIGFFFANGLKWQFEVWLLLFAVSTCI
jgi:hypothetical protein